MPSIQDVKENPDSCTAIQTTRELYCQVDEAMDRARQTLEGQEQTRELLDKMVHPKDVSYRCWQSITQREAIRDFDGTARFRKIAFQPHHAREGIDGDPADGWDSERSEKYIASLAHSGQQLACYAALSGLEAQVVICNLVKRNSQLEEKVQGLQDTINGLTEKMGALEDIHNSLERTIGPRVEALETKVGDQDDIAGHFQRVNEQLHVLANALGDGELKRRTVGDAGQPS